MITTITGREGGSRQQKFRGRQEREEHSTGASCINRIRWIHTNGEQWQSFYAKMEKYNPVVLFTWYRARRKVRCNDRNWPREFQKALLTKGIVSKKFLTPSSPGAADLGVEFVISASTDTFAQLISSSQDFTQTRVISTFNFCVAFLSRPNFSFSFYITIFPQLA